MVGGLALVLSQAAAAADAAAAPSVPSAPAAGVDRGAPRRLPAAQLAANLVLLAEREWRAWGRTTVDVRDGHYRVERTGARETDVAPFDARARLRRYWIDGLRDEGRAATPEERERRFREDAWSAVFVSWLMREAGLSRAAFAFDDRHANYLRGLAASPQFDRRLARTTPLARGDLLCGPRNASHDPAVLSLQVMREVDDLETLRASHCDLVVAVDRRRREARLIGGNVEDSVALTRIGLTSDGRAVQTLARPWFLVVRPR